MADEFRLHVAELDDPIEHAAVVVPSDGSDLANFTRAVYIGTSGDLAVELVGMSTGSPVTFVGLEAGWHPLRCRKILSTGTTASNIIATW